MRGGRIDVTDGANRTFGGFGGAERVSGPRPYLILPTEPGCEYVCVCARAVSGVESPSDPAWDVGCEVVAASIPRGGADPTQ